MIYPKLFQTFLRQFSTELNKISCAYIKCKKEGGFGGFYQNFPKFSKRGMIKLQIVQSKFSYYFSHHYAMAPLPGYFLNLNRKHRAAIMYHTNPIREKIIQTADAHYDLIINVRFNSKLALM